MTLKSNPRFALGLAAVLALGGLIPTQAGVISAGHDDSFSLQADGSLWAWGHNGTPAILVADYTTNEQILVQEANQLGLNIPRSLADYPYVLGPHMDAFLYFFSGYATNTPTQVGANASWVGIYASPGTPYELAYADIAFEPSGAPRTFGLQRDGSLWAWGYDGDLLEVTTTNSPAELYVGKGALGLGNRVAAETFTYTNSSFETNTVTNYYSASVGLPTRIGTDADWENVAPGSEHTLALKKNGSLWSWGHDGLGIYTVAVNARTNREYNYAKGALGLGVDLMVSTWATTNGIGSSREYVCNEYVQPVSAPAQIGTATNWAAATAGYDHSLAIKADGSLYAWGANGWSEWVYVMGTNGVYDDILTNIYGVLGLGNVALRSTNAPTRVGTDLDWSKVAAGSSCSFAIKKDGSLWAWGDNGYVWNYELLHNHTTDYAYAYGRLGLGSNVLWTNLPTRVGTDNDWTDIAVSMRNQTVANEVGASFIVADANQQCLALKTDGSLWAWGYSWMDYDYYYIPYSIITHVQAVPIRVGTDNDWVAITAGLNHSLALKSDGSLWAWGENTYGQLGLNTGSLLNMVQVGSQFTWGYAETTPAVGDYDGDGKADFVLYDAARAACLAIFSSTEYEPLWICPLPIGGPGYRMVAADFDGDRTTDPAVYQEHTGAWQAMLSGSGWFPAIASAVVGGSGCAAAAADFDGDGKTDPAVYRDGNGEWQIRLSRHAYMTALETLGGAGSLDVSADYNNDGLAEVATYRRATGNWQALFGSTIASIASFGGMNYIPAVADYDGDGKADPAIYEPGTGRWRILFSAWTSYWEYDSAAFGVFLEGGRCIPVPADYDGDGKADPAVYNPVTWKWTVLMSKYGWARWTSPW